MSGGPPNPVVEVQGLTKVFGTVRALANVDLTIERGEFFGCFGPNGAGKTTLLRILTGQIAPSEGLATVMGIELPDGGVAVRERVGVVPEFESPPSFLSGDEYLRFVCRARRVDNGKERVDRWVDFFELGEHRHTLCKDMSKGMRQKVMLGAAFIHEPSLLFLDEPFINLDPLFQKKVQTYLLEYIEGGGTIFMCSHLLEIAERLCSCLSVMHEGRIVETGTLDELKREGEDGLADVFLRLVGKSVDEEGEAPPASPEPEEG